MNVLLGPPSRPSIAFGRLRDLGSHWGRIPAQRSMCESDETAVRESHVSEPLPPPSISKRSGVPWGREKLAP
jgi:hypothetical protein